ncbi:hypothetical protein ABTZ03_10155 [Kitasatospora sp. NPDC096077]|uniref:hypothetical protein n=1 Tax=Kitasatospora sp. NPDC096077 TaxID=3155544 RepID=UPI0033335883
MPADFQLTWELGGHGWADCTVSDRDSSTVITASNITTAPEDLLAATARLALGATESRAQFNAEPTIARWILYREGSDIWIRILELPGDVHDNRGTEIWSSQQPLITVVRAVVRCFDSVAARYRESAYRGKWGEHFPRQELEVLRRQLP